MAKKKNPSTNTPVEAHIHKKDKRINIPTAELKDFVKEDEAKPKKILYPRDPSLDPQLVWKGKDEQDQKPLEIPAVPIYIQEKIHPQVLIEDLRKTSSESKPNQLNLFADFNGIEFEKDIDFYKYEKNWSNRMILGDSLLVMNSLAEKEGLKGKVQMIYFDPPYGIRFGSNWQVSTKKRDVKDGKAEDLTRQPEQIRAFRDTWELGIHSYLSYLRDRLVIARELLTETGSVFVQIGDENVHLVRCLLDEVFGSENHIANINYRVFGVRAGLFLDSVSDNIVWYAKNRITAKYRQLYLIPDNPTIQEYEPVRLYRPGSSAGLAFDFDFQGKQYRPPSNMHWATGIDGLSKLAIADRLVGFTADVRYKRYATDFPYMVLTTTWSDTWGEQEKSYVVQTSTKVIGRCLLMTTDPGDLVLDPTCGSSTTAYVAEQWGRRWITIDTSKVALALARTRLMSAKYPYYKLADSEDIKKGFTYKTVPHVTLKSIANNPDIKEGMTREEIGVAIARHAGTEILYDQPDEDKKRIRVSGPFTVESLSPHRILAPDEERPKSEKSPEKTTGNGQFELMILENLKKAGVQNTVKNERLKFDRLESFAGLYIHGEGEYTENGQTRRVAISIGPEHGTVSPELVKEAAKEAVKGVGFDLLIVCGFAFDPYANEVVKQFLPESSRKSKDPIISESIRQYGKLTVLLARMNHDLAMGDEVLKKTGAGNLFMVFGEPDIEIKKVPLKKEGKGELQMITVEIKGLDVYDPTTGQIRSHSTNDIACWFIDTDYNEESFFVRHAYFCGADEPYEKLKKALRAEIDESAWTTIYSTKSRPFSIPSKGKIAIKVINHYGDEVLKVYDVKN
ncbi:MAG: DNA methylase [Nitrospinae bacterium RIFCSPLOWO2_12_FULL_45_22]|nr:MAG: DNA methylase [Nitrospinae bacterium RIFCSPLOWO2_12_FULL_45_22]